MEIKGDTYAVSYEPDEKRVSFRGVIRLHGNDYDEILKLLRQIVLDKPDTVTLDVTQLKFLNSSGINHLFKFAVNLRNQTATRLVVKGTSEVLWQQKSLKNLLSLTRNATLEWD